MVQISDKRRRRQARQNRQAVRVQISDANRKLKSETFTLENVTPIGARRIIQKRVEEAHRASDSITESNALQEVHATSERVPAAADAKPMQGTDANSQLRPPTDGHLQKLSGAPTKELPH